MHNITINRIEPTNPQISSYVSNIRRWDKEGKIQIEKDNKILPFYAIYFDANFLAASTIELDKEKSYANVNLVNGSINYYEKIQVEATQKIFDLLTENYGVENINFNYVKRR